MIDHTKRGRMVRNYTPKNKYWTGSKLSDSEVESIISGYLRGYKPAQMTATLKLSERTVNSVCERFRRRILSSRSIMSVLLSPGFEDEEAIRLIGALSWADEKFWDELWQCLRSCPHQFRVYAKDLHEYYEYAYKLIDCEERDIPFPIQSFTEQSQKLHFYIRPKTCFPDCRPDLHLPIDPIMMAFLSSAIQRKRLNRTMLPEHFIPLYTEIRFEITSFLTLKNEMMSERILFNPAEFLVVWQQRTALMTYLLCERLWPVLAQEKL